MRESWGSRRDASGRFVQPWMSGDDARGRGLGALMRWQLQRLRHGVPPSPDAAAYRMEKPALAQPRNATGELRITWVGHATFLIQVDGVNILTDPIWSTRASPVSWAGPRRSVPPGIAWADLPPIDVVIVSHDHYDHLDAPTVRRLHERFGTSLRWVTPLGYADWFVSLGVRDVVELDWWGGARLRVHDTPVEIHATPAQHWTKRTPLNERTRLWASFVVRSPAHNLFFCGDSGYFDGFSAIGKEFGPFSSALIPIGAYEPRWFMKPAHMNPEEAVRTWLDLGGSGIFTAMHWGTFRLTDEDPLEPPRRTAEAWSAHGLPSELLWVPRHGGTRIIRS